LNGVALAYIMDIDELTYDVLVPPKMSILIRLLGPVKVKFPLDVPVRSIFLGIPLIVTVLVVAILFLSPFVDMLLKVENAVCPALNNLTAL